MAGFSLSLLPQIILKYYQERRPLFQQQISYKRFLINFQLQRLICERISSAFSEIDIHVLWV